jgi:hypothetical protein
MMKAGHKGKEVAVPNLRYYYPGMTRGAVKNHEKPQAGSLVHRPRFE